jgi:hypothetical protein
MLDTCQVADRANRALKEIVETLEAEAAASLSSVRSANAKVRQHETNIEIVAN